MKDERYWISPDRINPAVELSQSGLNPTNRNIYQDRTCYSTTDWRIYTRTIWSYVPLIVSYGVRFNVAQIETSTFESSMPPNNTIIKDPKLDLN